MNGFKVRLMEHLRCGQWKCKIIEKGFYFGNIEFFLGNLLIKCDQSVMDNYRSDTSNDSEIENIKIPQNLQNIKHEHIPKGFSITANLNDEKSDIEFNENKNEFENNNNVIYGAADKAKLFNAEDTIADIYLMEGKSKSNYVCDKNKVFIKDIPLNFSINKLKDKIIDDGYHIEYCANMIVTKNEKYIIARMELRSEAEVEKLVKSGCLSAIHSSISVNFYDSCFWMVNIFIFLFLSLFVLFFLQIEQYPQIMEELIQIVVNDGKQESIGVRQLYKSYMKYFVSGTTKNDLLELSFEKMLQLLSNQSYLISIRGGKCVIPEIFPIQSSHKLCRMIDDTFVAHSHLINNDSIWTVNEFRVKFEQKYGQNLSYQYFMYNSRCTLELIKSESSLKYDICEIKELKEISDASQKFTVSHLKDIYLK